MSAEKIDYLIDLGSGCKNPECGHSSDEHPITDNYLERPCTRCGCKSFEFLTRLNFSNLNQDLAFRTSSIQLDNVALEKKIDQLEDAYGKSQKEVERLKKKIKQKNTKNKELQYAIGMLEIELQLSENVKRNLKHILDKEE